MTDMEQKVQDKAETGPASETATAEGSAVF
ncbi:SUF system Fe-S cluster assembly protein, partial [Brucella melitensis]|nr:SUF system Fe-S cluster assembly protein [Brucella melitensis]